MNMVGHASRRDYGNALVMSDTKKYSQSGSRSCSGMVFLRLCVAHTRWMKIVMLEWDMARVQIVHAGKNVASRLNTR